MKKYLVLAAIATICVSLQAQADLVGYWEFSETTGTVAVNSAKPGTGDGQLLNFSFDTSSVADRFGNTSGALQFNSARDSYINAGTSDLFNCYPQVTLAAWVYVSSTDTLQNYMEVVSKHLWPGSGPAHAYALFVRSNMALVSYMANDENPNYVGIEGTPGAISKDAWHHIAVTHDGTAITTYLDGVLMNTAPMSGLDSMSGAELRIGQTADFNSNRSFGGTIDEIAIWNHGLTAAEIADVYNYGVVVPEPATMALLALGGLAMLRRRR